MGINKYLAKECGIEIENSLVFKIPDRGDGLPKYFHYEWDYKDPRCTAIIEAHFKLRTSYDDCSTGWWECEYPGFNDIYATDCATPHEARCKCIEALHKRGSEHE